VKRKFEKQIRRSRRRRRSKRMLGTNNNPRLVVYRSLNHIYSQIVDDQKGETVVSASSVEKGIQSKLKSAKSNVEKSEIVGRVLAERAKTKKIGKVVFDRNGFLYHGRIKALADGARTGGLKF